MALTVAELQAILRLRDELSPALKMVQANTQASAVSFGFLERIGQRAFDALVIGAGQAVAGIGSLAVTAVRLAGDFEQTQIAFSTMLGSAQAAGDFLRELEAFAARTPFEFPDLTRASQKLVAMGFAARDVIPMMTAIGDAAAGLGGGAELIDRLTLALGQMQAKGKVAGGEMRQLAEAGIPAWRFLADEIGTSVPEAMDRVEKGAVSAKVGIDALIKGMGDSYSGLMEQQAKTLLGQFSTLKDNFGFVLRDFGTALAPAFMLALQAVIPVLDALKDLSKIALENRAAIAELVRGGLLHLVTAIGLTIETAKHMAQGYNTLRNVFIEVSAVVARTALGFEMLAKIRNNPLEAATAWRELRVEVAKVDAAVQEQTARGALNMLVFEAGAEKVGKVVDKMALAVARAGVEGVAMGDRLRTGGSNAASGLNAAADAAGKLGQAAEAAGPPLDQIVVQTVAKIPVGSYNFSQLAGSVKKTGVEFNAAAKDAVRFGDVVSSSLKSLPGVILSAIQGGGDVAKAAGSHLGGELGKYVSESFGQKITGLLGNTLGNALSSVLPGLGSILGAGLGSLVGRIGGAIGGLFRNEEIEKLNDMRDAFFEAHGGWQAFAQEMERAGQEDWAGKIFRAKTVEEFNALVRESQDILSAQGESQQALNDAVERYGFTIDELGPKWKQQELDKMAAQLLKDYRLLVASGIDVTTVIERMGPAFSQYVDTALAAGVAIPESMRATIDALFQQGKLVHENGEAFTEAEYKSLSFTESMTESLSRATAAIERLVAALTGVPANVSTTVTTHHRNEYDGRPGADPFAYHDGSEMPQYAAGISRVPRDGMAYLHRDERVVPASENMGGDGAMAAELAAIRRQLEQQPNDIARAVRDALQRV